MYTYLRKENRPWTIIPSLPFFFFLREFMCLSIKFQPSVRRILRRP